MNTRFFNALILTMENGFDIIKGELWVKDDKVYYTGESKPSDIAFDREIDANGNLIMPGFKDAHTHSTMTFLRSYADDLPLHEWLYNRVFPMEANMNASDYYALTKLAVLEYLSSGVTSVLDSYYETEQVARAFTDCGFRVAFCSAVNDFRDSLEILEEQYLKYNSYNPLVSYHLGFHAEYTTNSDKLEKIGQLAEKYKTPVMMHNSETASEVADCIKRYGKTPTELFEHYGLFNYGGTAFHCIYLSENDMDIFNRRNVWAVTNPASNAKLASGIAPICKLSSRGVKLAIGTDGAASNNCLDMFREMFLVTALQKILTSDAAACPAEDVLYMAACGGAKAMRLDECDCLAMGKKADLIMLDLHQPNMQPLNNIVKNIVYSGSKQNVKLTMINGKILYENGVFNIDDDVEEIYSQCNRITREIENRTISSK